MEIIGNAVLRACNGPRKRDGAWAGPSAHGVTRMAAKRLSAHHPHVEGTRDA